MSKLESKPINYNDLPSFFKQKLWNNKSLTFQISRDNVFDNFVTIKLINDERNNTKSPK